MREVIQKIIETENKAKATVEAARAEADRILSDARKRAGEITEQARVQARAETAKIMEEALAAAEEEKRHHLEEARARIESQVDIDKATREQAIQGVVRCVCGLK